MVGASICDPVAMSDQSLPSAGWYPDPAGPGSRYWDGARWTEHTQPVAIAPALQPPVPGQHPFQPAPPGLVAGALATTAARPTPLLEQLKRGEGAALVLLGAVLVAVSTFLPWAKVTFFAAETGEISDSGNAWATDMPWRITGFGPEEFRVGLVEGRTITGSTDAIIFVPLLIAAVALVLAARQGKRITYGAEAAAACCGLLLGLLVVEVVHLGGWVDDLQQLIVQTGGTATVDGGAAIGLWVAIAAAGLMAFGAIRSLLAGRAR